MRQDSRRGRRRERSARQVVQRWEELPVVPAFCSFRLGVFSEVTVSVCPLFLSVVTPPHPLGMISFLRKCLGGISLRKVGAFSLGGGEAIRSNWFV
jgi:hypothetical protein